MKNKNITTKIQFVFLEIFFIVVFGVLTFIGSYSHFKSYTWLYKSGNKTTAVVYRVDESEKLRTDSHGDYYTEHSYTAYVSYFINDLEYNSSMKEGNTIYIYYNPENPYEIVADTGSKFSVFIYAFCSLLGIVNIILGIFLVKITIFGKRKKKKEKVEYLKLQLIGVSKTSELIKEDVIGWTYEFKSKDLNYLYVTEDVNEIYEVGKTYKVQLTNGNISKVYNEE
jgi:hypothetical protein